MSLGQQLILILFTGWAVLVAAILFNVMAGLINLTGWYDYLAEVRLSGFWHATKSAGFFSCLFMYIIYPAGLGYTAIWFYERLKLMIE
jgi:hypothetical protein